MPALKKNEKVMLVLIGISIAVFAILDPYYLWKQKPIAAPPPGKGPAVQAQQPLAAAAKPAEAASAPPRRTVATERIPLAGWRRDPFVRTRPYMEQVLNLTQLKLGAISVRREDRYALINARVVRPGDEINGMRVESIERDRVILVSGNRSYTLTWEE